jgi:hypothetical protein
MFSIAKSLVSSPAVKRAGNHVAFQGLNHLAARLPSGRPQTWAAENKQPQKNPTHVGGKNKRKCYRFFFGWRMQGVAVPRRCLCSYIQPRLRPLDTFEMPSFATVPTNSFGHVRVRPSTMHTKLVTDRIGNVDAEV